MGIPTPIAMATTHRNVLVAIEYDDAKFNATTVWAQAWRRLKGKIHALEERTEAVMRRAESRGEAPPRIAERDCPAAPWRCGVQGRGREARLEQESPLSDTALSGDRG